MEDQRASRTFGGFRYSATRKSVVDADGELMPLRPKSLAVFRLLAERADGVVTKDELIGTVWAGLSVTDDSLVQCVADIRRALGDGEHRVLRTVSGRGYLLVADKRERRRGSLARSEDAAVAMPSGAAGESGASVGGTPASASPRASRPWWHPSWTFPATVLLGLFAGAALLQLEGENDALAPASAGAALPLTDDDAAPSIVVRADTDGVDAAVVQQTRRALGRYRSVRLLDGAEADFVLRLGGDGTERVTVNLVDGASGEVLLAESFDGISPGADAARGVGVRVAAMTASPGGGAIGRHLLATSRSKPVETLSRAECYAHGYGCTTCSGELESITPRAEACLARTLREHPDDARAWALQSTVYAHRYQWGLTLAEPARTNMAARAHLPALARGAAGRAAQLDDGTDSAVYWGMVQAYGVSCRIERMREAIDRGLEINPDDPNLLAAYGNWLAYAGHWDEGAAMVERALEIEPRRYRRWWLFAPAKRHYARGEYAAALAGFRRAFDPNNWLSHLQLAYTLPHLGRLDEARAALDELALVAPGMTLERALQLYRTYCFENDYLVRMKTALVAAGLPSRGASDDFDDIRPPVAKVIELRGHRVEYMDLGSGVPIVFVHGASSDYRTWSHYQNPVSERHRYVAYSRRYYGSQPWPDAGKGYSNATFAADLVALIEALELGPVFLVSWSSGARAASVVAATRPDLVRGAIHYEPVLNALQRGDGRVPTEARDRFLSGFGRVLDAIVEGRTEESTEAFLETVFERPRGSFGSESMFIRQVVHDSARTLPFVLRPVAEEDAVDCALLGRTTVPTLVVRGEWTNAWWRYLSRRFAECVPGAEEAVLRGVNHAGPIRKPPELFALIEDFVDRHAGQASR